MYQSLQDRLCLVICRTVCSPALRTKVVKSGISMDRAEVPVSKATLKPTLSPLTTAALAFEESRYTRGTVAADPFYSVSEDSAEATAGTLLKVEENVDTSLYMLPPATAMSRIIFQSKTLLGSLVPVSAYILRPYTPRTLADGDPVVAWAHGTSG